MNARFAASLPSVASAYRPRSLVHGQRIGRCLTRALLSVEVSGLEHVPARGPVIIAGNHTGILDGPLVMSWVPRPVRVMTKSEIYRGLIGTYLCRLGQIPLVRQARDRAALGLALNELAVGGAVGVFPEGTRGVGDLAEIKDGVGYLAAMSGAPIVPVACIGSQAAMPKGAKWPRRSAHIKIAFGPAFTPSPVEEPLSRAQVSQLSEVIRQQLRNQLASVAQASTTSRAGGGKDE